MAEPQGIAQALAEAVVQVARGTDAGADLRGVAGERALKAVRECLEVRGPLRDGLWLVSSRDDERAKQWRPESRHLCRYPGKKEVLARWLRAAIATECRSSTGAGVLERFAADRIRDVWEDEAEERLAQRLEGLIGRWYGQDCPTDLQALQADLLEEESVCGRWGVVLTQAGTAERAAFCAMPRGLARRVVERTLTEEVPLAPGDATPRIPGGTGDVERTWTRTLLEAQWTETCIRGGDGQAIAEWARSLDEAPAPPEVEPEDWSRRGGALTLLEHALCLQAARVPSTALGREAVKAACASRLEGAEERTGKALAQAITGEALRRVRAAHRWSGARGIVQQVVAVIERQAAQRPALARLWSQARKRSQREEAIAWAERRWREEGLPRATARLACARRRNRGIGRSVKDVHLDVDGIAIRYRHHPTRDERSWTMEACSPAGMLCIGATHSRSMRMRAGGTLTAETCALRWMEDRSEARGRGASVVGWEPMHGGPEKMEFVGVALNGTEIPAELPAREAHERDHWGEVLRAWGGRWLEDSIEAMLDGALEGEPPGVGGLPGWLATA